MLYYFFSNKEKENAYLFDGLKIIQNHAIMKHQNQYPVIFITLKQMKGETFQQQKNQFAILVFNVIEKNLELLSSNQLSDVRKQILSDLHSMKASDEILSNSLQILCESLSLHYHQKVILLIDEYDVPLQNAYINGYYKEMTYFINHVFSSALKTNDSLKRGILTGCLRIAKESIFTGLNNFTVRSIIDKEANDYFGFRQNEIDKLLSYYHLEDKQNEMKAWYDGYFFGGVDIYNPWSAMNYVSKLLANSDFIAESFWANTSSNDIIREYIENSSQTMKEEFEQLIQGKSIVKKITQELTYADMDFSHCMNDDI